MKYALVYGALLATLLLNSCCSSCRRFWDQVENGAYYDEFLQTKVESGLAENTPDTYKSVARVILSRSGSEQSFSLLANVKRSANQVSMAGMADLGNVMFIVILDQGRVTIKKNMSGWGDDVLTDVLGPMAQTIFLPHLVENAIIQQETENRLQHRSRRGDGNQETFVFDRDGRLWQEYTLRAFSFLGEIERVQRIRFSDFKPIPDWPVPYPHRIEVDDEIHGFKARISVRSLTPN